MYDAAHIVGDLEQAAKQWCRVEPLLDPPPCLRPRSRRDLARLRGPCLGDSCWKTTMALCSTCRSDSTVNESICLHDERSGRTQIGSLCASNAFSPPDRSPLMRELRVHLTEGEIRLLIEALDSHVGGLAAFGARGAQRRLLDGRGRRERGDRCRRRAHGQARTEKKLRYDLAVDQSKANSGGRMTTTAAAHRAKTGR